MLSVYRAGEIGLFENLDIVHIRFLVDTFQFRHLACDHGGTSSVCVYLADQFGKIGLVSAPRVMDLYQKPSTST